MFSYTVLYGLFVLTSLVLFNALILLARYVRDVKTPPTDEEFEALLRERNTLQIQKQDADREVEELKQKIVALTPSSETPAESSAAPSDSAPPSEAAAN